MQGCQVFTDTKPKSLLYQHNCKTTSMSRPIVGRRLRSYIGSRSSEPMLDLLQNENLINKPFEVDDSLTCSFICVSSTFSYLPKISTTHVSCRKKPLCNKSSDYVLNVPFMYE